MKGSLLTVGGGGNGGGGNGDGGNGDDDSGNSRPGINGAGKPEDNRSSGKDNGPTSRESCPGSMPSTWGRPWFMDKRTIVLLGFVTQYDRANPSDDKNWSSAICTRKLLDAKVSPSDLPV